MTRASSSLCRACSSSVSARVTALGLLAADAELEEGGAEALDLLLDNGPRVERRDDGAEPAGGGNRLQTRDARSQYEHLRGGNRAGSSHEQGEEARQPLRGDERGLVARDRALRREGVHGLRPRDPGDRLERETGHAPCVKRFHALAIGERVEEGDEHGALAQKLPLVVARGPDLGHGVGPGGDLREGLDPKRTRLRIGIVVEESGLTRGRLDNDLEPVGDEATDGLGHERHTTLARHGLSWDADLHCINSRCTRFGPNRNATRDESAPTTVRDPSSPVRRRRQKGVVVDVGNIHVG